MATWNHLSENGMATSNDPIFGGIIDSNIVSGEWFVIPNSDEIEVMEGFATKAEAMEALDRAVQETYVLS